MPQKKFKFGHLFTKFDHFQEKYEFKWPNTNSDPIEEFQYTAELKTYLQKKEHYFDIYQCTPTFLRLIQVNHNIFKHFFSSIVYYQIKNIAKCYLSIEIVDLALYILCWKMKIASKYLQIINFVQPITDNKTRKLFWAEGSSVNWKYDWWN